MLTNRFHWLHRTLRSSGWRTLGYILALALLPLAVWAQDDDDKPTPLDPHTKSIQLWIFGAVAGVILLFVIWYWLRWRGTVRAGRIIEGENQSQE